MICAAQHDPVAAFTLLSSLADTGLAMVDGIVRVKETVCSCRSP
jgi:hypothetical protein